MIHIEFDPGKLQGADSDWWADWLKGAEAATLAVIDRWKSNGKVDSEKDFDSKVWKALKDWMLDHVFRRKCAYCEVGLGRQVPEAEHFRPKAGVNFRQDYKRKKLTWATAASSDGIQVEHPGYFWLAYHWRNLFPSCKVCNCGQGKNNQFPVATKHVFLCGLTANELAGFPEQPRACPTASGFYFLDPLALDQREAPLLLNPFIDEPRDHLTFGVDGIEVPLTTKGEHSVEVFNLKSDDLRRLRAKEQIRAESFLLAEFNRNRQLGFDLRASWDQAKSATIDFKKKENVPHLGAVLDWVEKWMAPPFRESA